MHWNVAMICLLVGWLVAFARLSGLFARFFSRYFNKINSKTKHIHRERERETNGKCAVTTIESQIHVSSILWKEFTYLKASFSTFSHFVASLLCLHILPCFFLFLFISFFIFFRCAFVIPFLCVFFFNDAIPWYESLSFEQAKKKVSSSHSS